MSRDPGPARWVDCPCATCQESIAWPADCGADGALAAGLVWLAVLLTVLLLTPW